MLLLYGAYYGMTEGAERALAADFTPVEERGRAYGLYHAAVGFAALPGVFFVRGLLGRAGSKGRLHDRRVIGRGRPGDF